MSSSNTFIFRDSAGNGVDGKSIVLRSVEDNNISYTLIPVAGKPGGYVTNSDVYFSFYKAYVDGEEDKSFGGDNGRPLGNPLTRFNTLEAFNNFVSAYNTTISGINTSLAGKAGLASTNYFSGVNTFSAIVNFDNGAMFVGKRPVRDNGIGTGNFATDEDFVCADDMREAIAAAMVQIVGYSESPNRVRVFGNAEEVPNKVYYSIPRGINSFFGRANLPNPSSLNLCHVMVDGIGKNAQYMISGPGSLKDYVNVIAAGRHILVHLGEVNVTKRVTIENATIILGGDIAGSGMGSASDRTFQFVNLKNCRIYHWRNLTIKGGDCIGCEFISPDGMHVTFDKDYENKYSDVINCVSRTDAVFTNEANYGGAMNINTLSKLQLINDPTSSILPD